MREDLAFEGFDNYRACLTLRRNAQVNKAIASGDIGGVSHINITFRVGTIVV